MLAIVDGTDDVDEAGDEGTEDDYALNDAILPARGLGEGVEAADVGVETLLAAAPNLTFGVVGSEAAGFCSSFAYAAAANIATLPAKGF